MKLFNEPTYSLKLTSQNTPLSACPGDTPYPNLDALVDKAAHDRFKEASPTAQTAKDRKQIAYNLVKRPDQNSILHLRLKLAKDQGLFDAALKRLSGNKDLAELVFLDCSEDDFRFILGVKAGQDAKLFEEACKIREELDAILRGITKYSRPQTTRPSEAQNGRINLDSKGNVIYSTGEIETEEKAHQVLHHMISQTLSSGQIELENLTRQNDGSYLYPVLIENFVKTPSLFGKEKEESTLEDSVLKSLSNTNMTVTFGKGQTATLKLKLMHFSSKSENQDGLKALEEHYLSQKKSLPPSLQKAIEHYLTVLKSRPNLRDKLMLRALICELLNIPYHVHSTSGHDQSTATLAIKKGLHLWLRIEAWKGPVKLPASGELFNHHIFREYTEAALFELLPLTDRFSGVLDGELYTSDRGFDYPQLLVEDPLLASVLSERHLYVASLVERVWKSVFFTTATVVLSPLYAAVSIAVLGVLYCKYGKEEAWDRYKHRFLPLLFFPIQSSFRKEWVDRNDKVLKGHSFFFKETSTKTAPALQKLYDQVNSLADYNNLLQFIQSQETVITDDEEEILKALANNWTTLQEIKSPPRRIKKLLQASEKSPLLLFYLLRHLNQSFVEKAVQENEHLFLWPAENSYDQLVSLAKNRETEITENLKTDIARDHHIIVTPRGRYELPISTEPSAKWDSLQNALYKLSVFKNEKKIPAEIQESLTQKIYVPLELIFSSIYQTHCHKTMERAIVVEEGDGSYFWLTIENKTKIHPISEDSSITFEFNYRLKISKAETGKWSTQFISMTPFRPTIESSLDGFLDPVEESNVLAEIPIAVKSNLDSIIKYGMTALQKRETYDSRYLEQLLKQHETNVVIRTFKTD